MFHDFWTWGGYGMVFTMVFWVAVIIGLVFLIKWVVEQSRRPNVFEEESALDILKKRYARGEIEREEFEQKKKDLST